MASTSSSTAMVLVVRTSFRVSSFFISFMLLLLLQRGAPPISEATEGTPLLEVATKPVSFGNRVANPGNNGVTLYFDWNAPQRRVTFPRGIGRIPFGATPQVPISFSGWSGKASNAWYENHDLSKVLPDGNKATMSMFYSILLPADDDSSEEAEAIRATVKAIQAVEDANTLEAFNLRTKLFTEGSPLADAPDLLAFKQLIKSAFRIEEVKGNKYWGTYTTIRNWASIVKGVGVTKGVHDGRTVYKVEKFTVGYRTPRLRPTKNAPTFFRALRPLRTTGGVSKFTAVVPNTTSASKLFVPGETVPERPWRMVSFADVTPGSSVHEIEVDLVGLHVEKDDVKAAWKSPGVIKLDFEQGEEVVELEDDWMPSPEDAYYMSPEQYEGLLAMQAMQAEAGIPTHQLGPRMQPLLKDCLLYTSDAADDM
jgi:hypothetical protein